jgi:hypothetical protein
MTAAAIAGALIAPLQRLTAISMKTFPAQDAGFDMLAIFGSQSYSLVRGFLPRTSPRRPFHTSCARSV